MYITLKIAYKHQPLKPAASVTSQRERERNTASPITLSHTAPAMTPYAGMPKSRPIQSSWLPVMLSPTHMPSHPPPFPWSCSFLRDIGFTYRSTAAVNSRVQAVGTCVFCYTTLALVWMSHAQLTGETHQGVIRRRHYPPPPAMNLLWMQITRCDIVFVVN